MTEFLCQNSNFKKEFYPVYFTNHVVKPKDDSQYLNNQANIADRLKSMTDILDAKTGLKEMKICSPMIN